MMRRNSCPPTSSCFRDMMRLPMLLPVQKKFMCSLSREKRLCKAENLGGGNNLSYTAWLAFKNTHKPFLENVCGKLELCCYTPGGSCAPHRDSCPPLHPPLQRNSTLRRTGFLLVPLRPQSSNPRTVGGLPGGMDHLSPKPST